MNPACCAHPRATGRSARALKFTWSALPGAIAILLPKCPLCIAAWVAAGAGIALPAVVAASLKPALAIACVLSIALLIGRALLARPR